MNKEMRNEEVIATDTIKTTEESTVFAEPINLTTYQSVIITLSDGSKHIFTGPVVLKPGDPRSIKQVRFTMPKKLMEGYEFGKHEPKKMEAECNKEDGKEGE